MSDKLLITKEREKICPHNKLTAIDNIIGTYLNIQDDCKSNFSNVCGMFTYKKYICVNCKKIITVLNAIVEESNNGQTLESNRA